MRQAPHDTGVIGSPTRTMEHRESGKDPNAIRDNGHRKKETLAGKSASTKQMAECTEQYMDLNLSPNATLTAERPSHG